jgi:hypothetical protein
MDWMISGGMVVKWSVISAVGEVVWMFMSGVVCSPILLAWHEYWLEVIKGQRLPRARCHGEGLCDQARCSSRLCGTHLPKFR